MELKLTSVFLILLGLHCHSAQISDQGLTTSRTDLQHHSSTTLGNEISIFSSPSTNHRSTKGQRAKRLRKNSRLFQFLRQFHFDFGNFDTTCLNTGRSRRVEAPPVKNARILKYTRKRNRVSPRNRYGLVLYVCSDGYEFPEGSGDRMFCSNNKWVGPRPVCLRQGTYKSSESECSHCTQICQRDTDTLAPPNCACYNGYEMVNGVCLDVNECTVNNGGCAEICFNKPGSFQCSCPPGFQVAPDGKMCIDKNECLLRNGHGPCQDLCNNTNGHYVCSCETIPGTKLASDKHSCADIDECEDGRNFGCSHGCLNTFGNAFCSCPAGYGLSTLDYKTCLAHGLELIDNEPENLVEPSEETVTAPSSQIRPELECPPGSEPDSENEQICVEHEDCSRGNGGCDHICEPSGDFRFRFCSCRPGYELLNETSCADVNECDQENGGCDQQCVNAEGTFNCDCKPGYYLLPDKRTCQVKFCEDLPPITGLATWTCDPPGYPPPVGTRCKLQCQPGTVLQLNERSSYESLQYEYVRDQAPPDDPTTITCLSTGLWSRGGEVTCLSTNCPPLLEPDHGSLFPETCLDDTGVPVHSQCFVTCSAGFYPRNGRIRTCSKGLKWFPEEILVCLKLPPTPRPHIHCPSDLIVDLKPGQGSAHVVIPPPQANMDWYRYVEADPRWAKTLEWDVPAGVTQVRFTVRSPISNDSATCHFKIHIVDREAPRVQGCPTSFEIRLDPGETSKEVWWSDPKFTDNVHLHYVQQSHNPGYLFTKGTHHIGYVAGDAEGNKARCVFTVTVHGADSEDHYGHNVVNGRHMIICPNLKTGRWNVHFAYYLPPGCRYHSPQYGILSKMFKQNTIPDTGDTLTNRLRRRSLARILRRHRYK